jgi:hypothetical protein
MLNERRILLVNLVNLSNPSRRYAESIRRTKISFYEIGGEYAVTNLGPSHRHGGMRGAIIGGILAVAVVLVIDALIDPLNNNYWLPAGIAMGIVGGGVIGLLFAEIWIGGKQDEEATAEALATRAKPNDTGER